MQPCRCAHHYVPFQICPSSIEIIMQIAAIILCIHLGAILSSTELPFRIRKTHDGVQYDLIFMPLKIAVPGENSATLHYRITGNINGENISEIASPQRDFDVKGTSVSYKTETGIKFVLQDDKNKSPQLKVFVPETESVNEWMAPRIKKIKAENDAMAAKYGFSSITDLNEFRRRNSELINKAASMGETDPLAYAVKFSQRQSLNENRPDHIIQWKTVANGLKGKYQSALAPVWTKGDLASVSEKKALRSAIFEVARSRIIFTEVFFKNHGGHVFYNKKSGGQVPVPLIEQYHKRASSLNESDRNNIRKNSLIISFYTVPLDSDNIPLSRDVLNQIGELADALFFISSNDFDFSSFGEINSVSIKYYQ